MKGRRTPPRRPLPRERELPPESVRNAPAAGATHTEEDEVARAIDLLAGEDMELLPVLPLCDVVLFPGMIVPIEVSAVRAQRLLESVAAGLHMELVVVGTRAPGQPANDDPPLTELSMLGTRAQVLRLQRLSADRWAVVLSGVTRVRVCAYLSRDPYVMAVVEGVADHSASGIETSALVLALRAKAKEVMALAPDIPGEVVQIVDSIEDAGLLADVVVANLDLPVATRQELLETTDVAVRLRAAISLLHERLMALKLREHIDTQVREELVRQQKELVLRQKMLLIQRELGETALDPQDPRGALEELSRRVAAADLPSEVAQAARRELGRLRGVMPIAPEFALGEAYLDWLVELPWSREQASPVSLERARAILDEEHYGLEKVKRRLLEYLAILRLRPGRQAPLLCLLGPPGVGKTSLGKAIARALGRRFVRLSLGGVADDAEIRGHRRTYVNAMPGRILQSLRRVKVRNPVFALDEIDKLGRSALGDPGAALLEVLDPDHNYAFVDHYIELPFDLSRVLFIATANQLEPIPAALRDRLEVIEIEGYTLDEKLEIARRHLVPRLLREHGLRAWQRVFPQKTVAAIVEGYTREAGVRCLERELATACRDASMQLCTRTPYDPVVRERDLLRLLGPRRFEPVLDEMGYVLEPGTALGLGRSAAGGELLCIEVAALKGNRPPLLTGRLGRTLRESAHVAFDYLRARARSLGVDPALTTQMGLHLHIPAGAISKDGPSLGLPMLAAMRSLFAGRALPADVALVGEITLRGALLPARGIRQRLMAAQRAGLRRVVLPWANRRDVEADRGEGLDDLELAFARDVDEALALVEGPLPALMEPSPPHAGYPHEHPAPEPPLSALAVEEEAP